jgi:lipoprotein-anchoring transpeptidase ErfK/SrfK
VLELFLSLSLLCYAGECIPVAYGPDTIPGEYLLTTHLVPQKDQAKYGEYWIQIGDDKEWGIHGWPNFNKAFPSHGCVRINKADIPWVISRDAVGIKIIGPNKYKKTKGK